MNLRQRTLLHTGAIVLFTVVAMYAVLAHRLETSYDALERAAVEGRAVAVRNSVADTLETLRGQAKDWAYWDDLFAFAGSADPGFIETNVTGSTFDDLKIDLLAVFGPDGRLIFGRAVDPAGPSPLPEEFVAMSAKAGGPLSPGGTTGVRSGLLQLSGRPLLFAAYPILRSDETGPRRGTLVFARSFDAAMIKRLESLTGIRLSVHPVGAAGTPADIRDAGAELLRGQPSVVRTAGPDHISYYWLMEDSFGRPAMILRADATRPVYTHGRTARRYLLGALLLCGTVILGVNLVFLDSLILRRIGRISRLFEQVRTSGDTSARLRLRGGDELARMGASFDRLLETLEDFRRHDHELSITDPLTGVYNRRHFNDKLAEELERAKRYGRALSLVILDVDYFKEYNDARGHPEGDRHLKRTAELLRAMTRKQDIVTRFGGDEFALLLPETPKEAARGLAERIRARASAEAAPTLSLGVATYPDDAPDPEALTTEADRALYKAKDAGRDRVETP